MRAIHLAHLDKIRPVVVLTRDVALGRLNTVTVAPITSAVRGIAVCLAKRVISKHRKSLS